VRFNNCEREWHDWKGNFFGDKESKEEGAQEIIREAGPEAAYR